MPFNSMPDADRLRHWAQRCEVEAATCTDPARKAQLEKMRLAFLALADAEDALVALGGLRDSALPSNGARDRPGPARAENPREPPRPPSSRARSPHTGPGAQQQISGGGSQDRPGAASSMSARMARAIAITRVQRFEIIGDRERARLVSDTRLTKCHSHTIRAVASGPGF